MSSLQLGDTNTSIIPFTWNGFKCHSFFPIQPRLSHLNEHDQTKKSRVIRVDIIKLNNEGIWVSSTTSL